MNPDLTHWRKLGLVYHAGLAKGWMGSHGSNPVAGERLGDRVRVYFNCRDEQRRAHVAWVDVDFSDPLSPQPADVCDEPVLGPGERGMFDDSGTSLGNIVITDEGTFLYYVGWNLSVTVPWRNSIGLAVRPRGATSFERCSRLPILDRSREDPFSLHYPWVIREGRAWRMWYGTIVRWVGASGLESELKYAWSDDGIAWHRRTEPVLTPALPGEYALSRPSVVRDGDRLHMWYTSRGEAYRIFHASSKDGLAWQREPPRHVLDVSPEGWDAEMTCYPAVFEYDGRYYMLYSGNGYGRTGFGIALAE